MRTKKIKTVFPAGRCRCCGKKLPSDYRYFCPDPDRWDEKTNQKRASCAETFAYSYDGIIPGEIYRELGLCVGEEELRNLEMKGFFDFVNNPARPKHPLCLDCPHDCKVAAPAPDTPTGLICRKTQPEIFDAQPSQ